MVVVRTIDQQEISDITETFPFLNTYSKLVMGERTACATVPSPSESHLALILQSLVLPTLRVYLGRYYNRAKQINDNNK